jgi:FkbM family methyltransferase
MRWLFQTCYSLYCRSFLHPHLGALIKRSLRFRNHFVARGPFVHDLGIFRMHLDLTQLIDTSIYYMGTFEAECITAIRRHLPAGGTAVDVGANIGFMTMHMAAAVGRSGRVVSFEPTTWTYHKLETNLALNDMPQVVTERAALGARSAVHADLLVPYSYPLVGDRPLMRDTIVISTLDSYFAQHPIECLDLIKCDTDGWEMDVFEGALDTLRRYRPALILEVDQFGLAEHGRSAGELIELLREVGYQFFHEADLRPFEDLEAAASRVTANHKLDVVAMHKDGPRASR